MKLCLLLSFIISSFFVHSSSSLQTKVWLTISSLANSTTQRNIEINWSSENVLPGDWIGIFTKNPNNSSDAIKSLNVNTKNGYKIILDIEFPYQNFSLKTLSQRCLKYHIAYIRNDQIIAKNCIKNNPFWMGDNLALIGHKTLVDIVIPGTHDAGSYDKYNHTNDNLIIKYSLTQDESIYNQLVYGIRYFDMRLGYYDESDDENDQHENYWIVHGIFKTKNTLKSVCHQIKQFLSKAPKEIIIFDFHSFEEGFAKDLDKNVLKQHFQGFFHIVTSYFNDYLIPYSLGYNVTIDKLIQMNKRVLVGFERKSSKVLESDLLWPNVKHQWQNKDDIKDLENSFDNDLCKDKSLTLKSAMAELTPEINKVIKDEYGGLRKMADQVNHKFDEWFAHRWRNCVNIIAADYFLGSNLVDISIDINKNVK